MHKINTLYIDLRWVFIISNARINFTLFGIKKGLYNGPGRLPHSTEIVALNHKDAYLDGSSDSENESVSEANSEVEYTGPRKTGQNEAISR